MFRPVSLALAAAIAVAGAGGCDDKPKATPPAPSAAPLETAPAASAGEAGTASAAADAGSDAEVAVADAGPDQKGFKTGAQVKLLSAGKEPLTRLRYALKGDTSEKLDFTTTSTIAMDMGDQKVQTPVTPGVRMHTTLSILDVDADGIAKRKLVVDKVGMVEGGGGLAPEAKKQINEQLSGLEKLTVTDKMDSRGQVRSVKLAASGAQDPQLQQLMGSMEQTFGQMGAPFPEEEVGVGAKWQIAARVEQMGFRIDQTTVYELVELKDNKGKIKLVLKQTAVPGPLKPPGLPEGAKARLISMRGGGTGELRFDLARSMPDGQIDTKSDVKLELELGDDKQQSTLKTNAKVVFKRAK